MKYANLVIAVAASLVVSSQASAAPFDGLVLFGDSSLDVGNYGRFTNGPVWGEYLAGDFNLPVPKPSNSGGTNYSWGGARTGLGIDNNPITGTLVPTVGKQIDDYLSRNVPNASTLIIVQAGYNDIAIYNSGPATIVSNLSNHISTLAAAGAKHILVPNLIPLGNSPAFRRESMNQTAAAFNQLLSPQLENLESQLGITIYQNDFFGLIRSVIADPSAFGLQNVKDSAGQNPTVAQTYLYWDDFHFTTAAHRILSDSAITAVTTVPGDFNNDRTFDAADYVVWRKGLETNYTQADYNVWRAHFGQTAGSGAAGYPLGASAQPLSADVPEPATSLMLLTVALVMSLCRRVI